MAIYTICILIVRNEIADLCTEAPTVAQNIVYLTKPRCLLTVRTRNGPKFALSGRVFTVDLALSINPYRREHSTVFMLYTKA